MQGMNILVLPCINQVLEILLEDRNFRLYGLTFSSENSKVGHSLASIRNGSDQLKKGHNILH